VAGGHGGGCGEGLSPPFWARIWEGHDFPSPERCFYNFQVKMQGFMHFCENYLWPETGTGGINRPMGAEDVKRSMGLKI